MTDRLFDVGPDPEPEEELGQDARRTRRRNELLAAGVHPTTRLRLREPAGETCGSCDWRQSFTPNRRTFHKCAAVAMTHGPATDVRLSWPACSGWTKAEPRSWASISPNGVYRWTLGRRWGRKNGRRITWVMLNPSTADHELDDQTIGRCRYYSHAAGFDELVVVNHFAYRTSSPDELIAAHRSGEDIAGIDNLTHVFRAIDSAEAVAFAWGANLRRVEHAGAHGLHLAHHGPDFVDKPVLCLGYTADGSPRHPARLGNDVTLIPYDPPAFRG